MTIATTIYNQHRSASIPEQKFPTAKLIKNKYESCPEAAAEFPLDKTKKSKVKQLASMFDSQICQNVNGVKNKGKCSVSSSAEAKSEIQAQGPLPSTRCTAILNADQQQAPVPTPRAKSKPEVQQNCNTNFVPEDGLAKLTVKHKVQLFNQFTTSDVAQKNSKFVAELPDASAKKSDAKSEVVSEKQPSVKHILAKLEATAASTSNHIKYTSKRVVEKCNLKAKAKEFEDVYEQSSKTVRNRERRSTSLVYCTSENEDSFAAMLAVEPAVKRSNEQMRYCLPFEANAPPKKIRRTRAERLAPKLYFPCQESKNLFFIWLNERQQKQNANISEHAKVMTNSSTDQLLQETLSQENGSNKKMESKARQRKKKTAPPVPQPRNKADNSEVLPANISVNLQAAGDETASTLSLRPEIRYAQSENLLLTWLGELEQKQHAKGGEGGEIVSNCSLDQHLDDTVAMVGNEDSKKAATPRPRKKKPAPPVPQPRNEAPNSEISTNAPAAKLSTSDENNLDLPWRQKICYSQSENLLLTWLGELDRKQNGQGDEAGDVIPKSSLDQHLENSAAAATFDSKDKAINEESKKAATPCKSLEPTPRPRKKKPAPPVPATRNTAIDDNTFTSMSFKPTANDETASSLQKISSDEAQAVPPELKSGKEFEFAIPARPAGKKKLRRKCEKTAPTTNSTDSDNEFKLSLLPRPGRQSKPNDIPPHPPSSDELDSDLLREANSPRKIKSAYTLTAYSPSPSQEDEEKLKNPKRNVTQMQSSANENAKCAFQNDRQGTSPTCDTATMNATQQQTKNKASPIDVNYNACNGLDSFTDQGFETGSNDMDSPVTESTSKANKATCSSSPAKGHQPMQFTDGRPHQELGIPITMPLKSRRKSIYDNESRRSSLAMQVIREDQPLVEHKMQPIPTINTKAEYFAVNAAAPDIPSDLAHLIAEKTSRFWIKCGYFCLSFDIFYNDANRVRLLLNIFSQKSCDTKDLAFGIDNFTFSVSDTSEKKEPFSKRLPPKKEYSHYWFSTGDLVIPFAGKRIPNDKIQQTFQFLKAIVGDSGVIRFGIDGVEFSNVRDFWNQSPKFSMDSNYSMLVGLQSGNSNGLEGRSKYAWPHTTPARVSDLNQADYDDDNFDENNSGRSSLSPFSDKQFEFTASSPIETHPNQFTRASDVFAFGYKNDSLDYLFDEPFCTELPQPVAAPAPLNFNKIQTQSQQENPSSYHDFVRVSCAAEDALKGTPHYLQHLKSIVTKIINRHRRNDFNGGTV